MRYLQRNFFYKCSTWNEKTKTMNKIILIGHVGKDPEIQTLESGKKVAKFTIATSEKWKTKDGEKKEVTDWHNITFFGNIANVVEQYVKKGDKLAIEGKAKQDKYEKDGVTKYFSYILGSNLEMLGSKSDQKPERNKDVESDLGDDLPF